VVLAVHQFGSPADLDRLQAVADRRRCRLVEDAACALGAEYKGRKIGARAVMACFSFHPRKIITTGEGGMIVTDDPDLAERLRRIRNHGRNLAAWQRHEAGSHRRESYVELGHNYRLSDVAAAIGVAQMERVDAMIQARRRLGDRYDAALLDHPHLDVPQCHNGARPNRQTYGVTLRDDAPRARDALLAALTDRRISALPGLACIHREPCYSPQHGHLNLPRSEGLAERMLLLPMFPEMTDAQQQRVVDALYEELPR
jgi:perosamine synthetase